MQDGSAVMFMFCTSDNSPGKFQFQVSGRFSEMINFFFRLLVAEIKGSINSSNIEYSRFFALRC